MAQTALSITFLQLNVKLFDKSIVFISFWWQDNNKLHKYNFNTWFIIISNSHWLKISATWYQNFPCFEMLVKNSLLQRRIVIYAIWEDDFNRLPIVASWNCYRRPSASRSRARVRNSSFIKYISARAPKIHLIVI